MLSEAEAEAWNAKVINIWCEVHEGKVEAGLLRKRQELDDEIESLSGEQKKLKADTPEKKTWLFKGPKLDRPTTVGMENILSRYEVCPAR
jgi:hypothetical protein